MLLAPSWRPAHELHKAGRAASQSLWRSMTCVASSGQQALTARRRSRATPSRTMASTPSSRLPPGPDCLTAGSSVGGVESRYDDVWTAGMRIWRPFVENLPNGSIRPATVLPRLLPFPNALGRAGIRAIAATRLGLGCFLTTYETELAERLASKILLVRPRKHLVSLDRTSITCSPSLATKVGLGGLRIRGPAEKRRSFWPGRVAGHGLARFACHEARIAGDVHGQDGRE